MAEEYIERVVDLTEPEANQIYNLSVEDARELIFRSPAAAREIQGSFALIAREGKTVKMARSLDRPMRYFLAKRAAGPVLVVAHRIDAIRAWLDAEGLGEQFQAIFSTTFSMIFGDVGSAKPKCASSSATGLSGRATRRMRS